MKKLITAALAAFVVIGCNNADKNETESNTSTSTESDTSTAAVASVPSNDTRAPLDSATVTKNWMSYMTPGKEHELMASWNGNWQGTVTMWHAPGAPPEISKATTTNKMLLGGRYQVGNHSGSMMGQPFEGMSTLAFDNAKKVFVSTWIDNVGTGLMKLEGPWDESSRTMTLSGRCVDPSRGDGSEMTIRETFRIVDDKNHIMEMYGPGPDGKEFKMMEIKYTRQ